jgi:hypothetical protein
MSDREDIANSVWGGELPQGNDSPEDNLQQPDPQEIVQADAGDNEPEDEVIDDPWAGVPVTLRGEVESLREKVSNIDTLNFRLKQAESRLGGVLNELHASKEAAKATANAPTKEQIDKAAADSRDWAALKEDFPEWTQATENKLAAERAEILRQMPDVSSIRGESASEIAKLRAELSETIVSVKHPKWIETINSPDFVQWHAQSGKKDSENPIEVISILDEFTEFKKNQKAPRDIADERKKRLEASQTTPGQKIAPAKSEADMSESEIRASMAKQIWANAR